MFAMNVKSTTDEALHVTKSLHCIQYCLQAGEERDPHSDSTYAFTSQDISWSAAATSEALPNTKSFLSPAEVGLYRLEQTSCIYSENILTSPCSFAAYRFLSQKKFPSMLKTVREKHRLR